jgi:hypothetical protein
MLKNKKIYKNDSILIYNDDFFKYFLFKFTKMIFLNLGKNYIFDSFIIIKKRRKINDEKKLYACIYIILSMKRENLHF